MALADNRRLNDGVVANVYTIEHQRGCINEVKINPQLQLAAQWHANDLLNNRTLDGDIGSDGSTVQDPGQRCGVQGGDGRHQSDPGHQRGGDHNQWFYRPDYIGDQVELCKHQHRGWSENNLDRSVVVAVYGSRLECSPEQYRQAASRVPFAIA